MGSIYFHLSVQIMCILQLSRFMTMALHVRLQLQCLQCKSLFLLLPRHRPLRIDVPLLLFYLKASQKHPSSSFNPANIEEKHKSWRGTHNSKTSMMLFLHAEKLHDRAITLDGKAFSTNGVMRCCYNGFGQSAPCKSYLPTF